LRGLDATIVCETAPFLHASISSRLCRTEGDVTFANKLAECKRLLGAVDPLSDELDENADPAPAIRKALLALAELYLSARDNERGEVCAVGRHLDWSSFIRDCASDIRSTTAVRPLQLALAGAAIDGGDSDYRDLSLALTALRDRAIAAGFSAAALRAEARRIAPDVVDQGPPWGNVFGA
jgi:hypothetical protein